MLLNLRSGQIDASVPEAVGFAVEVAELVTKVTGHDLGVWQTLYGRPLGTLSWSAQVDSFADLAALNQKLAEDASYLEKTDAARSLFIAGSFEDSITRLVHTAGTPGAPAFSSGVQAVAAPGKQVEAMTFGAEIADYVSSLTGESVMFCADAFAAAGGVTWVQGHADAAAVDTSQEALAADAGYLERIGAIADVFLPGTATGFLAQRLN